MLNEPQPSGPNNDNEGLHDFLNSYYDGAIRKARETLPWETPVVLFSWTYDFWRWGDNRFPYDQYGKVVWDTHIYTPGSDDVNQVLGFYDWDLSKIRDFQNRQNAPVIIGEFAFSNLKYKILKYFLFLNNVSPLYCSRGEGETAIWQQYVDSIFPKFQQSA